MLYELFNWIELRSGAQSQKNVDWQFFFLNNKPNLKNVSKRSVLSTQFLLHFIVMRFEIAFLVDRFGKFHTKIEI